MSDPDDDLKTLLAKRQHAKPTKATWILLALIAVAIGFALGALARGAVPGSSSSTPGPPPAVASPPAIASDPAGAIGGQGQQQPGPGFAGRATMGTIVSVEGDTMVVATRDGSEVTVVVPDGTPVTTSVEVPLAELPEGATVIVRGSTGGDGTVTAEAITEGGFAPGVPALDQPGSPQ